jgi:hypothetical protein
MSRSQSLWIAAFLLFGCATPGGSGLAAPTFINPPGLAKPNGFSHVVEVPAGRTLYVWKGDQPGLNR